MNTAENETWGECVDEMVICNEDGVVGAGTERAYRPCTGGHHTGFQKFIRCTSSYHQQDGPMSPGIAFMPTPVVDVGAMVKAGDVDGLAGYVSQSALTRAEQAVERNRREA